MTLRMGILDTVPTSGYGFRSVASSATPTRCSVRPLVRPAELARRPVPRGRGSERQASATTPRSFATSRLFDTEARMAKAALYIGCSVAACFLGTAAIAALILDRALNTHLRP